jgi:hypothetical protein
MDSVTLSIHLEKRRHRHRDARTSATVFVRIRVLSVWSGARHHLSPIRKAMRKGTAGG